MVWVISTAVAAAILIMVRGGDPSIVSSLGFLICLAMIARQDWHLRTVPDTWLIAAVLLRLVPLFWELSRSGDAASFGSALAAALLGAVTVAGFVLVTALLLGFFTHKQGIGGGDVKLLAVAGWYFGVQGGFCVLLVASVLALPLAAVQRQRDQRCGGSFDGTFPFAPAITVACWLALLGG